jgi:hypothetical protein
MTRIENPEQAIKDLLAKRAVSDALQPTLNARAAETSAEAEPEESVETETGTITRYVPWEFPNGYVVIEMPSREIEAPTPGQTPFRSFEEAGLHAAQLNEWLARRPAPDARYRMFVPPPEPTEAALVEMIDRMYDTTALEEYAYEPVAALVADARPLARAADRDAREGRQKALQAAREDATEGEPA